MPDVMKEEFYFSEIKCGQELLDFVEPIRHFKKRECFSGLRDYVYGNSTDRVFILYGLRRTGKTTLIRQVIAEIKEYLDMLDITVDIDTVYLPDLNQKEKRTVITQPGLRYAQAEALIRTLMQDDVFRTFSLAQRNAVTSRILSDIQGRMMEDIVLLETRMAFPRREVFKLTFARGKFDMVVFDPEAASCEIYEVKHSTEAVDAQYRHLVDEEKCEATEFRFGPITGKYVIYRGESCDVNGIHYLNVEEYLKGLT